jgi:hypothetical protein
LAGLLAAALLLAGLLTRVLILLTRFRVLLARLVLVGHRISFVERNQRQLRNRRLVSREFGFRCDHCVAAACHDRGEGNPEPETTTVQAL